MNACEVVILIELNVVLALGEESNEQLHHDVVSSYLEVLVEASNLYGGSLSPAIFAPISSPNRLPAIIFNTLSSPGFPPTYRRRSEKPRTDRNRHRQPQPLASADADSAVGS